MGISCQETDEFRLAKKTMYRIDVDSIIIILGRVREVDPGGETQGRFQPGRAVRRRWNKKDNVHILHDHDLSYISDWILESEKGRPWNWWKKGSVQRMSDDLKRIRGQKHLS